MKKLSALILCGTWLVLLAAPAQALEGDAKAGKAKSATCAACHGADGNSPAPNFPKLAGQHPSYLLKQLKDFKKGLESQGAEGRYDPVMSPTTISLSEQDMADLAAYFGSQAIQPGAVSEDKLALGEKLYRGGNPESGVTACIACHGPRGAGMALAKYPALSGQHATYSAKTLKDFKAGKRNNDPAGMMGMIAKKMTDEEIEALAAYVSGLH